MTPIEVIIFCLILAGIVLAAFAVVIVVFELLYIVLKLLWLVFGIPARLLRTLRRHIP